MFGFQPAARRSAQPDPTPAPTTEPAGFGARGLAGLRDMIPAVEAMGYKQAAAAPAAPVDTSNTAALRAMIPKMEAMGYRQAAAPQAPQYFAKGGVVRGPGTGTSDSIPAEVEPGTFIMPADSTDAIGPDALAKLGTMPVRLSDGEFKVPPEQVMALGIAVLKLMKDATHEPVNGEDGGQTDEEVGEGAAHENAEAAAGGVEDDAAEAQGFVPNARERMAKMPMFADGGLVENDITRVGNSYSGGNVGGSVTINGAAPAGTFSENPANRVAAAPAPRPDPTIFSETRATATPATQPTTAAAALSTPPAAAPAAAPAPAAMGWAERNALRNTQVTASSILDSPERRAAQAALTPPPQPAAQSITQPAGFQSATQRLGTLPPVGQPQLGYQPRRYADGGVVQDDLQKRLAQIPSSAPPGWTGGGTPAAPATTPLTATPAPVVAAPAAAPAPSGALSRAASMATPTPAAEPAAQAMSTPLAQGFQPNAQNAGAADGLARRGAADAMALMPNAPPPVQAPTILHSGNDWASRKALENAATAASSITANGGRWDTSGAGDSPEMAAYKARLATDQALQQAQPAISQAAMREQGDTQRAGLQVAAHTAQADADRRAALERTLIGERGANSRAGIAALGTTEAARIKAEQANKAPPGYRYTVGGNMEAIPGGPADLKQNKEGAQQSKDTQDIFSILNEARPLLANATGSPAGVAADKTAQAFGIATDGAKASAQLKALEGALVSKMPKMSGPQSDKDVLLYKQMAGQIGDPTIPIEQRRAAMDTIESLNMKYLPAVTDDAGYNAVPSGSYYRTPAGDVRRKS